MKRGYTLKEKSKGNKNKMVRKKKRNEPQMKNTRKVCKFKMPLLFYFCNNLMVYNLLTYATIDEWPNSSILASSCLNLLVLEIENKNLSKLFKLGR